MRLEFARGGSVKRRLFLALFLGLAVGAAAGLPPEVVGKAARLRESALRATGGPAIVESLTDGVGSRLAGSDGSRAAERWALAELRKLGFENVHSEPLMEPRWTRGEESGEVVAPVAAEARADGPRAEARPRRAEASKPRSSWSRTWRPSRSSCGGNRAPSAARSCSTGSGCPDPATEGDTARPFRYGTRDRSRRQKAARRAS